MLELKTVLIFGVLGQDGSTAAEMYLNMGGYRVVGIHRGRGTIDLRNVAAFLDHENFILEYGDISDSASMNKIVARHQPDLCYLLAASAYVASSFNEPVAVTVNNYIGTINALEALRNYAPKCRTVFASSSEVYGAVENRVALDEKSPIRPNSPYAVSKYASELIIGNYVRAYSMFVCISRGFNHFSVKRPENYYESKVAKFAADSANKIDLLVSQLPRAPGILTADTAMQMAIEQGKIKKLQLGNIDVYRDYSSSKDICRGMHLALHHDKPDTYVFASGETWHLTDVIKMAMGFKGITEWQDCIMSDTKANLRPSDVSFLLGSYKHAKETLGWEPTITFPEAMKELYEHYLVQTKKGFHDTK